MALAKQHSKELQQVVLNAMRNAIKKFEKAHGISVNDFTCYGFKAEYGDNQQKWMAYVSANVIKLGGQLDYALEQFISDEVRNQLKLFQARVNQGVGLHLTWSLKKSLYGQEFSSLGFHWHTDY